MASSMGVLTEKSPGGMVESTEYTVSMHPRTMDARPASYNVRYSSPVRPPASTRFLAYSSTRRKAS